MKQFAFMLATTFLGIGGSFAWSPVYGIAVYYLYAVLRPQFIWEWSDFMGYGLADFGWSFYVAIGTLLATVAWRTGVFAPSKVAVPPWYGEPPYTRSHYLFLGFTFWICLTYPTAGDIDRAYPFFLEYVKIFLMFICATYALRTVRDLWIIYYVVACCAIYIGYEINFLYFVHKWLILQSRGYGGLDNNGAALILAMGVPLAFFAWEAQKHWIRWAFLAAIPMLVHAVLLSYSRGAMLSLCVVAPLMWVRTRHKWFVTLIYGLMLAALPFMAGREIQDRFFSIEKQDVDESANARRVTWNIAIRMAMEKPLFGFGIRNSNLHTFAYGADIPGRSIHSQYLQTAADSGLVALALYVGLLLSVFFGLRSVRRELRKYTDPHTLRVRSMASGLESALALFCFGAIFLSLEHFEMPYIILLLAVQLHAITRAVTVGLARRGGYMSPVMPVTAAPSSPELPGRFTPVPT